MKTTWKNRIVGYDTKPANQFTANPLNFRRHPVPQREALRGLLGEVGWVGAVLENVTTGNLIDGHARIEEALSKDETAQIPYLKVELTESEEKLVLASFDPISAMATADKEILDLLLKDVSTGDEAVKALLEELSGQFVANDPYAVWQGMPEFEQEDQLAKFSVKVNFNSEDDLRQFGELTGQRLTTKTRSIWFPPQEKVSTLDREFRSES